MTALPLLALLAAAAAPPGGRLEAVPDGEGIRIHVAKRGLFSGFAHDHDFEVTRWRGTAELPGGDPGRASLELVLQAGSLRDREQGLSDGDRRKVDAQAAGPDVLDAGKAPEITYRADRVSAEPGPASGGVRGTIHGRLTVRGQTRPLDATFEADPGPDGWRVRGRARFRQSEFGIRPFSGFGGTVAVKDEVEVTFALALRPAGAATGAR
jgi:polyisoprenoid-binding protein YceI